MGDSAGGGLALAALLRVQRVGGLGAVKLRVATISAYNDLLCSTPSYVSQCYDPATMAGDVVFSSGDAAADRQAGVEWVR